MPRQQTDLETKPFNLLTKSSGTITARFRQELLAGRASQQMMNNAIQGTIDYLVKEHGYEGYNPGSKESGPKANGGQPGPAAQATRDQRKITATADQAKEEAYSAPEQADSAQMKNYQCGGCGCLVQQTMLHCPGCGKPLHWERVRS